MEKIKKLVLITFGVSALACSAGAAAGASLPMGWYLEGNAGAAKISDVSFATNSSITTSGLGWNFNVGYKFMPYFAAELGYTDYAHSNIKSNGTSIAKDQATAYAVAGKAILPVQESGMEVFAKLGIARAKSNITVNNAAYVAANKIAITAGANNSTDLYLGLGGDYSFTPNMAANLQWARVDGNSRTGNLDLYAVGLTYTFD
jgi:hypothetical protein